MRKGKAGVAVLLCILWIGACTQKGVGTLFSGKSPYDKYVDKLKDVGLHETAIGNDWISKGERVLKDSILIDLPFKEVGYFPENQVRAVSYQFNANKGAVVFAETSFESRQEGKIFIDLFERKKSGDMLWKRVASVDSTLILNYEVEDNNTFLLRVQPELLRGGKYIISIIIKPSLPFPIPGKDSRTVGSFFGVDRDGGKRRHEGIDIFAAKRTPVVAVAEGRITGVNENNLGGKVVFLNDFKRKQTLYYAHLDTQLVQIGEKVKIGDTLGLVGNSGNARFTAPHLHFGVYTWGSGAINPLPFVDRPKENTPPIAGKSTYLNIPGRIKTEKTLLYSSIAKNTTSLKSLPKNTVLTIVGLSGAYYRVELPDGSQGFVKVQNIVDTTEPISATLKKRPLPVYDFPDTAAVVMDSVSKEMTVQVLGKFNDFLWIQYKDQKGWIYEKGANL